MARENQSQLLLPLLATRFRGGVLHLGETRLNLYVVLEDGSQPTRFTGQGSR